MYLVIKETTAEDFERQTAIACSYERETCKKLADRLNEAVKNVELFDNICSVSYYVSGHIPILLNDDIFDSVYNSYKEDRG